MQRVPKRKGDGRFPVVDTSEFIHLVTFLDQIIGQGQTGANFSYAAGSPPDISWAKVENVRGRDVVSGGQDTSQLYCTVTTNYRTGRGPDDRIQLPDGSILRIQSVDNVRQMHMFTNFNCVGIGLNE